MCKIFRRGLKVGQAILQKKFNKQNKQVVGSLASQNNSIFFKQKKSINEESQQCYKFMKKEETIKDDDNLLASSWYVFLKLATIK